MQSAHVQAYEELDHPLYVDFANKATGVLSSISLDEITTENTFRLEEHYEVQELGETYYNKAVNRKLTISDFMGLSEVEPGEGVPVLENVESVGWFKYMFRMDYEAQGFSRAEVKDILQGYVSTGELTYHKGYHPVKNFLSGLLDVTIIKPAIEAVTGKDLITHERLTGFERGMQGVDALIGVVTLGQGVAAAKAAGKSIFETVFKTWATDAISDTAAYTVGSICDENGVPLGITIALSGLTGCTVSKKAGKYLLTDEVSRTVTEYTAEEIQSLLKKADVDEIAEEGIELLKKGSKNGEQIIEGARREKEALEAAAKNIGALENVAAVKKVGALGNAFAGKKVLTEEITDGVQKAVKEIKVPDVGVEALEELIFGKGEYSYKIPIKGYSDFVDGMSKADAARYITNNEAIFFSEFSERARAAGLNDTQIEEAFCSMRGGNYTKMASYFDTSSPVDGAVFWSKNKEAAAAYANSIGGMVLEQTPGGQVFDDWRELQYMYPGEWGMGSDPQPIWEALSKQYANGASGKVTYVHPSGKVGMMWEETEQRIILKKLDEGIVTEIQEVFTDGK